MGNCLAAEGGGTAGGASEDIPALTAGEGLTNRELVMLLRSGTVEQRLAVLQSLEKATAKTDDECAAMRYSLIQEEEVLGPLTKVIFHNWRTLLMHCSCPDTHDI